MKVLFEDRYGTHRVIANVETKQEVNKAIADFLNAHNFKSYYTRNWIHNASDCFYVMYDVGSHSEYFCVPFDSYNEAKNFLENKRWLY